MTIHAEILAWARTRPARQRHALALLFEGPVRRDVIDEIADMARREYGADGKLSVHAPEHEESTGARPDVAILGVADLEHVNALKNDQRLPIGRTGLSVVYGENGAGKTGYVRVLKQLCRARGGAEEVLPDVYSDDPLPASAKVYYEVGGDRRVHDWTPLGSVPSEFREVSIFDSRSASVYVTEEAEVAYLPYGLDLLPKLSRLCDEVSGRLTTQIERLDQDRDRWDDFSPETTARKCLEVLHIPGTRTACERLAVLSVEERAQLDDLRLRDKKYRTDDPPSRAVALRQTARRLTECVKRWVNVFGRVSQDELLELREKGTALHEATLALSMAAKEAFSASQLGGVGDGPWLAMWRAARAFAEQGAVPQQSFPPAAGDLCVLCQQPIDTGPSEILAGFDEFVRGRLQRNVDDVGAEIRRRRIAIEAQDPAAIARPELLEEIRTLDTKAASALASSIAALVGVRALALQDEGASNPPIVPDPRAVLSELISRLVAEAEVFEAAALPSERKAVEDALRELEGRAKLVSVFDRIDAQIKREKARRVIQDAISSASTTPITRFSRELLERTVTEPLSKAFEAQRTALRLDHIPIGFGGARGEKGSALHGLTLRQGKRQPVPADAVLSEGEHRCIALAAFLALISTLKCNRSRH